MKEYLGERGMSGKGVLEQARRNVGIGIGQDSFFVNTPEESEASEL